MRKLDIEKHVFSLGLHCAKEDHVLLLCDSPELRYGIIIVARGLDEQTKLATVVSVGPKVRAVDVGDRVLLGKFYGTPIGISGLEGCSLVLVSEDQIDCVVTDG